LSFGRDQSGGGARLWRCAIPAAVAALFLSSVLSAQAQSVGGVAYADSEPLALDTSSLPSGGGGVGYADSEGMTLNTTALPPGGGGVASADSDSFALNTTPMPPGGGGVAYEDSGNFTLDTSGLPPIVGSYIWTNTGGGNWSAAANWSPNAVPGPLDAAYITAPGTYIVTLDAAVGVGSLILGGDDGVQTLVINSPSFALFKWGVVNSNAVLAFSGGTLSGPGSLTVNGLLNWTGGALSATTVTVSNTLLITGEATKRLQGTSMLVNVAAATWSGGNIELYSPAVISNAAGGTFAVNFGGALAGSGGTGGLFANAGLFNADAGSGKVAVLTVPFRNRGTVAVNSGTLDLESLYSQTSGLTSLNGGNITNAFGLKIQGGTLAGNGTVYGSVTNSGTVKPGVSLGQMFIGGDYVQTTSGNLDIALGGSNPGTGFGQLTVSNNAWLAGTLTVSLTNGFYPSTNSTFVFLTAQAVSNAFATLSSPGNLGLQALYDTTSASVLVVKVGPVLAPIPNYTVNAGQTISFTASATDTDPTRKLTFSVTSGPGVIGPTDGRYNWRPAVTNAGTSTNVEVTVTDNNQPPLSDSESFSVTINALTPVVLTPLIQKSDQFTMQVSGPIGPDYIVTKSTNLVDWIDLSTNASPATPFLFSDPTAGSMTEQYYRVRLAP
jgi:hypothetical protein